MNHKKEVTMEPMARADSGIGIRSLVSVKAWDSVHMEQRLGSARRTVPVHSKAAVQFSQGRRIYIYIYIYTHT